MRLFRILVVDDEPDIRKVIERTLARDPELTTRGCASGQDALAQAADWQPDLILLDVMMPLMDGPATLARLRENSPTARIPVVFLTARAQAQEVGHFRALGASDVIAKPFEPKALRKLVGRYLREPAMERQSAGRSVREVERAGDSEPVPGPLTEAELAAERDEYRERLRMNAFTLIRLRTTLRNDATSTSVLTEIRTVAHKLAGSAGMYGFRELGCLAAALQDSIIEMRAGRGARGRTRADLDALIDGLNESCQGVSQR